jgi:rubrerythrin
MSPYDFAMELEKEGESLYREFAESAPEKGMATIFLELAAQEKNHYETFRKMKDNQETQKEETSYVNIQNVFKDWKKNAKDMQIDSAQKDIYRKALDVEQKSIDLYSEKAQEIEDPEQKDMFLKIADEEKKHYQIVENIIGFMEKPEQWVEHAMFTKVGEEY